MDMNWQLILGFHCPEGDIGSLTKAILTSVGEKTPTGESTVWGIQRQKSGVFWVRFREAAARSSLLNSGGFFYKNKLVSVYSIGETVQWILLNDLPVVLELSSVKSELQQYGSVHETVYEAVAGFDDVYTGNLRVLIELREEIPDVIEVCGFSGRVVRLGSPSSQNGWASTMRQVTNSEKLGETTSVNSEKQLPDGDIRTVEKRWDFSDENDLETDAVPIGSSFAGRNVVSISHEDELQRLRYENMGAAIAWGYFFYLRDTGFNKLTSRIQVYEDDKNVEIGIQKIIILVPLYCALEPSEEVVIEHAHNLEEVVDDVAGTIDRKYHLSVYKMREGREKIYFIPETAQCLETLVIMCEEHERTGLTEPMQELIRKQFVEVLEYLLCKDKKCRGKYELLNIEGTGADLAKEIRLLRTNKTRCNSSCPNDTEYHWNYNHFGVGLANWFYFNYLKKILAELPDLMKKWEAKHRFKIYPKLIILVPKSCLTEGDLKETDADMEYVSPLEDIVQDCGTTKARKYSVTVYKVSTVQKSDFQFCIPQYATPIRQLYKMTEFPNHSIQKDVMSEIRDDFVKELKNLLSADMQHASICEVASFDDDEKKVSAVLKDVLEDGSCTPPRSH